MGGASSKFYKQPPPPDVDLLPPKFERKSGALDK